MDDDDAGPAVHVGPELDKLMRRVHQALREAAEQRRRSEEIIAISRRTLRLVIILVAITCATSIIADIIDVAIPVLRH